jgi:hypothetical protein
VDHALLAFSAKAAQSSNALTRGPFGPSCWRAFTHDILQVAPQQLVQEFGINVAALGSVQALLADLKQASGTLLLTGGGRGTHPDPHYGSLSIGKAGLRSLAAQLHQRLQPEGIYVGLLTITKGIQDGEPTYSPAALAEHFWQMAQARISLETTV